MKLSDQIQNDMTDAMKARDASRVDVLSRHSIGKAMSDCGRLNAGLPIVKQ